AGARSLLRRAARRADGGADRGAPGRALVGCARARDHRAGGRAPAVAGVGGIRAALAVALAALLTYALTGGGRIRGGDGGTLPEPARALAHGRIDVPEGATLRGPDGRFYSKNTAGEAILALPFVVVGDVAARAAGFRGERAEWAARFVASFFNAVVSA